MNSYFREEERRNVANYVRALRTILGDQFNTSDFHLVRNIISDGVNNNFCKRDKLSAGYSRKNQRFKRIPSSSGLIFMILTPDIFIPSDRFKKLNYEHYYLYLRLVYKDHCLWRKPICCHHKGRLSKKNLCLFFQGERKCA